MDKTIVPYCCGVEAKWVENVPGKGYNFCESCRCEVAAPLELIDQITAANKRDEEEFNQFVYYKPGKQTAPFNITADGEEEWGLKMFSIITEDPSFWP